MSDQTIRLYFTFMLLLSFFLNGQNTDAQAIIDRAIEKHGGEKYQNVYIEFGFRDKHYSAERKSGAFVYKRMFEDNNGKITDVLGNDGFFREVNGKKIELSEEWADKYSNSVNSVIYFALLPFPLNDPAVKKEYLGKVSIKGEPYDKIKITFQQEGGGKDFDDTFVYWFHQEKHTMDYLAYEFHVDGGGLRFREAFNQRIINDILFADFNNFKGEKPAMTVEEMDDAFEAGKLKKVSEIALKAVNVKHLE